MKKSLIAVLTLALTAFAGTASANEAKDAWITSKTKMTLLTAPDVPGTRINVDTNRGIVTLHGKVATKEQEQRAVDLAKDIEGVIEVRNLLQIVPASQRTITRTEDAQIKKDVKSAFEADRRLSTGEVKVESVNNGVVLLTGKTGRSGNYLRAVRIANDVPGVVRVESKIVGPTRLDETELYAEKPAETKDWHPSDMWTTSAVKMRLMAAEDVPANDINVDSDDGVVTLFGMVPTDAAKMKAEEEAKKVDGVTEVVNGLQVVASKNQDAVETKDDAIKTAVEKALASDNDVKGSDIDVEVSNGVVRLTGVVVHPSSRFDAAMTARMVPGVRAVRNDVEIKKPAAKG